MRTTVDLPDPLFRELKAVAARRGSSLKTLIRAAVEEEVRKAQRKAGKRLKFPLLSSAEPGTLHLTNAAIDDLSARRERVGGVSLPPSRACTRVWRMAEFHPLRGCGLLSSHTDGSFTASHA